jgi:uncharacterized protein (TIGR02145 family)
LKVTTYADGTALTQNNNTSDVNAKYYAYPNNASGNAATLGLLYTWAAATNRTSVSAGEGNTSGQTKVQGICPAGWHLPTDYEWSQLEEVIAKSAAGTYSSTAATTWAASYYSDSYERGTHGRKMKSTTATSGTDTQGTSLRSVSGGFDAYLAGFVEIGIVNTFGTASYYWSSSVMNAEYGYCRRLSSHLEAGTRTGLRKSVFVNVRCKKD